MTEGEIDTIKKKTKKNRTIYEGFTAIYDEIKTREICVLSMILLQSKWSGGLEKSGVLLEGHFLVPDPNHIL